MHERFLLMQSIASLGSFFELDASVRQAQFVEDIKKFGADWRPYNPRKNYSRKGLSITSLDGGISGVPDLDSLREYNRENGTEYTEGDFVRPTPVFQALSSVRSLLDRFAPHLGRSHLIRFGSGGFFPPHRDEYGINASCFRILALCQRCERSDFVFMLGDRRLPLRAGGIYFIDTRLEHSVFSFVEDCTVMVLNVQLNEASYKTLMHSVGQC